MFRILKFLFLGPAPVENRSYPFLDHEKFNALCKELKLRVTFYKMLKPNRVRTFKADADQILAQYTLLAFLLAKAPDKKFVLDLFHGTTPDWDSVDPHDEITALLLSGATLKELHAYAVTQLNQVTPDIQFHHQVKELLIMKEAMLPLLEPHNSHFYALHRENKRLGIIS